MHFELIEELKNNLNEMKGKKWLTLWDDNIHHYGMVLNIDDCKERNFICHIAKKLDKALYSCLDIMDYDEKHLEEYKWIEVVDKSTLEEKISELTKEYQEYVEYENKYPYMSFKYLCEIIAKHNIPETVRLLSNSGWECGETDMNGVFYHRENNELVFTQFSQQEDIYYGEESGWKEVSNKCGKRERFFASRLREYMQREMRR